MNLKKITWVGVASLVIFAISSVVAWVILDRDTKAYEARGVAAPAKLVGRDEIGIVDNIHFDADNRLEVWTAERQKRLNGYGWADRKKGFVHVPISEAMKQVIAEAGAQTPPAQPGGAAGTQPAGGTR